MMKRLHFFCLLTVLTLGATRSSAPAALAQPVTERVMATSRASDDKSMLVYPNPSTGIVHVAINGFEGRRLELQILNVIGSVIYRENLSELNDRYTKTLDLTKFAGGLYYIKIASDNTSEMRKLVIR
ncbi:T9SS type A sorting domain-containing protein [Hymenobacter sp. GOD-10R]|uniref:T9SS type A sorting domain-containing protein n=1 Tax=Hymenobacter sp. GOD-10R TaxID=3093922 RepID=UPI002D78F442|nr:T9SS type A sorting domain-containing protein [Hymenobacter sp. GOD-10R]WRQ29052.1 T9SS type A sorting domain-containing protein [Hymenobacter sp. GOD-10R]